MNRSKIEWTDYTWNPVTGCLNNCSYCYARRFAERGLGEYGEFEKGQRFQPLFHPECLDEPAKLKKPSKIFVCSMGELFGEWVPPGWTFEVLSVAAKAKQHTFQFLTKAPDNLPPRWPINCWVGATLDGTLDPGYTEFHLRQIRAIVRFISFEPLLGEVELNEKMDWYIIGAMTGPKAKRPKPEWVQGILDFADAHKTPVFLKDNLNWPEKRQEFPRLEVR